MEPERGTPVCMRTTKAALAGAGSSGALVAAVVCLFVALSAVIVFTGWPGGPGERIDTQAIRGSTAVGVGSTGAGPGSTGSPSPGDGLPAAQGVLGVGGVADGTIAAGASPGIAGGGGAVAGLTPARGRSQPRPAPDRGADDSPAGGEPSATETVTAIVERATRDFGPVSVDTTSVTGGAEGGGPAGGGAGPGIGDSAPDSGDVGDAIEEAGDRGADVVNDVEDAVGGGDEGRRRGRD
jgi:hypothetical protein